MFLADCLHEKHSLWPYRAPSLEKKQIYKHFIAIWRRKWQPTPVFLPGEFHGQRSLVGYSPGGPKESDKTEQLTHIAI